MSEPNCSKPAIKRKNVRKPKRHTVYKGTKISVTADFSLETVQATRQWDNMIKVIEFMF